MQPERSEDHAEIFNEVRLIFPIIWWRAITQDKEKIFHKGADILIEKNLYMKKKLPSAVITKERNNSF